MRAGLIKIGLLAGIALTAALNVQAQQRTAVTINEPPASYYKVGKAEVSYYAGVNTTEVRIDLPSYRDSGQAAGLWFFSRFEGKQIGNLKEVFVGIRFRSDKAKLQNLDRFVLAADNKPLSVTITAIEGLTFELDRNEWARALKGMLSFDDFKKLAIGQSARVRIGDFEYEMDQKSRVALRDMLKALTDRPDVLNDAPCGR